MNSLALRTLRTVSRSSTGAPTAAATLLRGSIVKSGVFRGFSTQGGDAQKKQEEKVEELPENPQELKELIQKMKTVATEKEGQAKETHVCLI